MALLGGLLPPSRENWELLVYMFKFFPIVRGRKQQGFTPSPTPYHPIDAKLMMCDGDTNESIGAQFTAFQWVSDYYPSGKTSLNSSHLSLPGKPTWLLMEVPGMLCVLYCFFSIPVSLNLEPPPASNSLTALLPAALQPARALPWGNWTMAGLYVIHYTYRAILFPLLNPSMSPSHAFVALAATAFNVVNGLSIGGWVGGYGPTTVSDWAGPGRAYWCEAGLVVFGWALLGNMFHDDELREIRREVARRQARDAEKRNMQDALAGKDNDRSKADGSGKEVASKSVGKVYMLPKNGLFQLVLHPHYLCEFCEWLGFWMVGGWGCVPARTFLINEVSTMVPRALQGWRWYVEKFGRDKVGSRKAIFPFLL